MSEPARPSAVRAPENVVHMPARDHREVGLSFIGIWLFAH
jgi:hypothetical protein